MPAYRELRQLSQGVDYQKEAARNRDENLGMGFVKTANEVSHLRGGLDELKANLWATGETAASLVGADRVAEWAGNNARESQIDSLKNPSQYNSFKDDINSVGDALGFVREQIVREVPALLMDGAMIGGAALLTAPAGGAGGAAAAASVAARRGAMTAAGMTSISAQTIGDARMTMLDEGVDNPLLAAGVGIGNAALAIVPIKMSIDEAVTAWRRGGKNADLGKHILQATGKIGAVGAVTEPLQELNKYLAIATQKDDYDILSDKNIDAMLMSALAGGGVSATIGGGATAAGGLYAMSQGREDANAGDRDELPPVQQPGDPMATNPQPQMRDPFMPAPTTPATPLATETVVPQQQPEQAQPTTPLATESVVSEGGLNRVAPLKPSLGNEAQLSERPEAVEGDERDIQALRSGLVNRGITQNPEDIQSAPVNIPSEVKSSLESAFGIKIVGFSAGGTANKFHGTFLPERSNTVFVNAASENPHMAVAGHETLHAVRDRDPELYDQLMEAIVDNMVSHEEFTAAVMSASEGVVDPSQINQQYVAEELAANVLGDNFADASFWAKVSEKLNATDPSMTQRLIKVLTDVLNKLIDAVSPLESNKFVRDVEKARDDIATFVAEQMKAKHGPEKAKAEINALGLNMARAAARQDTIKKNASAKDNTRPVQEMGTMGTKLMEAAKQAQKETADLEDTLTEDQGDGQKLSVNDMVAPQYLGRKYRGGVAKPGDIETAQVYKDLESTQRYVDDLNQQAEDAQSGLIYSIESVEGGHVVKVEAETDSGSTNLRDNWASHAQDAARAATSFSKKPSDPGFVNRGLAFTGPDGKRVVMSPQTLIQRGLQSLKTNEQNLQDRKLNRAVLEAFSHALVKLSEAGFELDGGKAGTLAGKVNRAARNAILAKDKGMANDSARLDKLANDTPLYTAGRTKFRRSDLFKSTIVSDRAGNKRAVETTNVTRKGKGRDIKTSALKDLIKDPKNFDTSFLTFDEKINLIDAIDAMPKPSEAILDVRKQLQRETRDLDTDSPIRQDEEAIAARREEAAGNLSHDSASAKGSKIRNKPKHTRADDRQVDGSKATELTGNGKVFGSLSSSKDLVGLVNRAITSLGLTNKQFYIGDETTAKVMAESIGADRDLSDTMMADANTSAQNPRIGFARVYQNGDKVAILLPRYMGGKARLYAVSQHIGRVFMSEASKNVKPVIKTRLQDKHKAALAKGKVTERDYPFSQWFADQTAIHLLHTAPRARGVVGNFFKGIADKVKNIINDFLDTVKLNYERDPSKKNAVDLVRFSRDDYFRKFLDNVVATNKDAIQTEVDNLTMELHLGLEDVSPETAVKIVHAPYDAINDMAKNDPELAWLKDRFGDSLKNHKNEPIDQGRNTTVGFTKANESGPEPLSAGIEAIETMKAERKSGYFSRARAFFVDPEARKEMIGNASEFIKKGLHSGHGIISKGFGNTNNRLRYIGAEGSKAREAAVKIADLLMAPPFRKVKPGFENVVIPEMGMWMRYYGGALMGLSSDGANTPAKLNADEGLSKEQIKSVHHHLVVGTELADIKSADIRKAVKAYRAVHERFYNEVVRHVVIDREGNRPGKLTNHYPRMWDHEKVLARQDELVKLIVEYGKKEGITEEAALKITSDMINRGLDPQRDQEVDSFATASYAKHRTLSFLPNSVVESYLVDDPLSVMSSYVQQMLKRYEFQSRFGGWEVDAKGNKTYSPRAKLDKLMQDIPSHKDKKLVEGAVASALGQFEQDRVSAHAKGAQALAMAFFNTVRLPLSSLSSFPETSFLFMRARDTNFKQFRAMLKQMREDKEFSQIMRRAREFGFTDENLMNQVVNSVYGSPTTGVWTGRMASTLNEKLFKWNGTMALMAMNRAMATAVGERFIVHHAYEGKNGDAKSRAYIAELIGDQYVDTTIDRIIRWNEAGRPTPKVTDTFRTTKDLDGGKTEISDTVLIQHILGRYVDESVVRPMSGHRPLWGNSPYFMLVAHLKHYFWSAQSIFVPMIVDAFQNANTKNLHALMPLLWFGVAGMALSALGYEARHWVRSASAYSGLTTYNGRQDMSTGEYMLEVFRRGNGFFGIEPYVTSIEFAGREDSAVYGAVKSFIPTLSLVEDYLDRGISTKNTPVIGVL